MVSVVIMAGGKGERFWPKSRVNLPKQFLVLTGDGKSMIQHTVDRAKKMVDIDNIYIVTNKMYKDLVEEHVPDLPKENILLEPVGKNTAPCIGLAAITIAKKNKDSKMVILSADHLIKYEELFVETVKTGLQVVENGENLVTIGITPNYPETGYGYIDFKRSDKMRDIANVYEVLKFVEKPKLELAKEYLASGHYLWNSGMFVWKTSTILDNFQRHLPEIYEKLEKISEAIGTEEYERVLKEEFDKMQSESIDYGIMEKAQNIYVIPGNFGWDDVGSWLSLERINTSNQDGNIVSGNVITIKTKNAIIQGSEKLIATVGVENIIVVDTEDALLICNKENAQDVKEIINNLKICNRTNYL